MDLHTQLEAESVRCEAEAVISDISYAVKHIQISSTLQSTGDRIYLNIHTKEDQSFCMELSARGFRIVGHQYNENIMNTETYYETIYSFLDSVSPGYRQSFSDSLTDKLSILSRLQQLEDEEESD